MYFGREGSPFFPYSKTSVPKGIHHKMRCSWFGTSRARTHAGRSDTEIAHLANRENRRVSQALPGGAGKMEIRRGQKIEARR